MTPSVCPGPVAGSVGRGARRTQTGLGADVLRLVGLEFVPGGLAPVEDDDRRRNNVGFALQILQRHLASSPAAIHRSLERRRKWLEDRLREERLARPGGSTATLNGESPGCGGSARRISREDAYVGPRLRRRNASERELASSAAALS